jgi:hypothetical protein
MFLVRWIINWILLNKINGTNYSPLKANYSFNDIWPLLKHIAISEWKFWWYGDDLRNLKNVSNILSTSLYFCIVIMIAIVYFGD